MIFTLHRIPQSSPSSQGPTPQPLQTTLDKQGKELKALLEKVSIELQGTNAQRYARAISPGIQELVEALVFKDFVETGTMSPLDVIGRFAHPVEITPEDYVLGVADVTGELCRRAIGILSESGHPEALQGARKICILLREILGWFDGIEGAAARSKGNSGSAELQKKMSVMRSSVKKVENAIFERVVRGSERPAGWIGSLGDDP